MNGRPVIHVAMRSLSPRVASALRESLCRAEAVLVGPVGRSEHHHVWHADPARMDPPRNISEQSVLLTMRDDSTYLQSGLSGHVLAVRLKPTIGGTDPTLVARILISAARDAIDDIAHERRPAEADMAELELLGMAVLSQAPTMARAPWTDAGTDGAPMLLRCGFDEVTIDVRHAEAHPETQTDPMTLLRAVEAAIKRRNG